MESFDPSQLNDAVALRTEWVPALRGGASFRTHHLVEVDPGRLEFRATRGAILFYLVFLLLGCGVLVFFGLTQPLRVEGELNFELLMPAAIGLVFALAGGAMLRVGTRPVVFDRSRRWFWIGREEPGDFSGSESPGKSTRFERIHALQILSERVSGKNAYNSFELNLVLEDGTRINVVDHGSQESIRRDAATVAAFLGKPVWDAS